MNIKELKELVDNNLSTHQIAKKLNCSQTNVRYWLRKYKLSTSVSNNVVCKICNELLTGNQIKYCSNKCRALGKYNNNNSYLCQTKRATERKQYLVNLRGGGCEKCGYNKCLAALEFHHYNNIKNFRLDSRRLSNTSMERILNEFQHCKVLCANCHREEHYNN